MIAERGRRIAVSRLDAISRTRGGRRGREECRHGVAPHAAELKCKRSRGRAPRGIRRSLCAARCGGLRADDEHAYVRPPAAALVIRHAPRGRTDHREDTARVRRPAHATPNRLIEVVHARVAPCTNTSPPGTERGGGGVEEVPRAAWDHRPALDGTSEQGHLGLVELGERRRTLATSSDSAQVTSGAHTTNGVITKRSGG